jgi:hypothetical protein
VCLTRFVKHLPVLQSRLVLILEVLGVWIIVGRTGKVYVVREHGPASREALEGARADVQGVGCLAAIGGGGQLHQGIEFVQKVHKGAVLW